MVEKKIGKQIQALRKKRGMTQEQLAEKVELSTNYLSAVERGINALSLDKLVEIMNCLECSADEIFSDVLHNGYEIKANLLSNSIAQLPPDEQNRIFEVIETLIKTAKKN